MSEEISIPKRLSIAFLFFVYVVALVIVPASPAVAGTPPTAPTGVAVVVQDAALQVNWNAPTYLGAGVTAYSVDYSTNGLTWTNANNSITGTTYTISSLTPGTNYYVRVSGYNGANQGPFGYPWSSVYAVTSMIRNNLNGIDYAVNNSASLINKPFTRVRYRLDFNRSGAFYADADMAKWDTTTITNANGTYTSSPATISNLRVPSTDAGNGFQVQTNVQDLTVVSSNSALNVSGKLGRLEIWPWNYSQGYSSLTPIGNSGTYDLDDLPALSAGYGSFQVHNVTDSNTVLAWNNHAAAPEVGIGNYGGANPDWTFCSNVSGCATPSTFRLEIFVNVPSAPTTPSSNTLTLAAPASTSYRNPTSITATTSVSGKVTFFANGKRIPGCTSLRTITDTGVTPNTITVTCSWKPSLHGSVTLSASFVANFGPNTSNKFATPVIATKRITTR